MDFDGPSLITLWPHDMNLLISFHVCVCVMSSQYNHNTKNLTYLIAHQTHTHRSFSWPLDFSTLFTCGLVFIAVRSLILD